MYEKIFEFDTFEELMDTLIITEMGLTNYSYESEITVGEKFTYRIKIKSNEGSNDIKCFS